MSEAAVRTIREGGIDAISLDLIFAIPDQVGSSRLTSDLDRAVALEPSHLSVYGLTVEPHTPLGRWAARGEVREAPEERHAELEDAVIAAERKLAEAREQLRSLERQAQEAQRYPVLKIHPIQVG